MSRFERVKQWSTFARTWHIYDAKWQNPFQSAKVCFFDQGWGAGVCRLQPTFVVVSAGFYFSLTREKLRDTIQRIDIDTKYFFQVYNVTDFFVFEVFYLNSLLLNPPTT